MPLRRGDLIWPRVNKELVGQTRAAGERPPEAQRPRTPPTQRREKIRETRKARAKTTPAAPAGPPLNTAQTARDNAENTTNDARRRSLVAHPRRSSRRAAKRTGETHAGPQRPPPPELARRPRGHEPSTSRRTRPAPAAAKKRAPLLSPRQLPTRRRAARRLFVPAHGTFTKRSGRRVGRPLLKIGTRGFVRENKSFLKRARPSTRWSTRTTLRNLIRAAYPSQTPTAARLARVLHYDRTSASRKNKRRTRSAGRIEWFMSKPDLGGYGEIVLDGASRLPSARF